MPARCTINGWSAGRPLTANTRATAVTSAASAARPYTVSVGSPTRPPARSAAAARPTSEVSKADTGGSFAHPAAARDAGAHVGRGGGGIGPGRLGGGDRDPAQ